MKKTLSIILACVMLCSLFAGCGNKTSENNVPANSSSASTETAKVNVGEAAGPATDNPTVFTKDTVVLTTTEGVTTFNTYSYGGGLGTTITGLICDGFTYQAQDGTYQMLLAESVEHDEDGKVWTIKLHPNVKFHDGSDLTTEDVIATMSYVRDNLDTLSAAKMNFTEFEDFYAVDDTTFVIVEKEPKPEYLMMQVLSQIYTFPAELIAQGDDMFSTMPLVGCGPWKYVEWAVGQYVLLERFDDYYLPEKVSNIQYMKWQVMAEETTAISALSTGEIDGIRLISNTSVPQVEAIPGIDLIEDYGMSTYFHFQFAGDSPFNDYNVRKAFELCIDREGIVEYIVGGGDVANSLCRSIDVGYDETLEPPAYDPELAKEYLQKSTYDGRTLNLMYPTYIIDVDDMMLQVVHDLEIAGFNVEMNGYTTAEFNERRAAGQYDVFFMQVGNGDPNMKLTVRVHDDGHNSSYYNEEMFKLIEKQAVTIDGADRDEVIKEIVKMMRDEVAPWTWGWTPAVIRCMRSGLTGYIMNGSVENYKFLRAV